MLLHNIGFWLTKPKTCIMKQHLTILPVKIILIIFITLLLGYIDNGVSFSALQTSGKSLEASADLGPSPYDPRYTDH